MAKKRETVFKERVLKDLRTLSCSWWEKIQQVGIRGTPDILGCYHAVFVAIELKSEEDLKADPLQEYKLTCIRDAYGRAYVATPRTWKKIFAQIKRIPADLWK